MLLMCAATFLKHSYLQQPFAYIEEKNKQNEKKKTVWMEVGEHVWVFLRWCFT